MPQTTSPCPICKRPSTLESRPFCSEGCKNRDLLQWLNDGYAIPGPTAFAPDNSSGSDYKDWA